MTSTSGLQATGGPAPARSARGIRHLTIVPPPPSAVAPEPRPGHRLKRLRDRLRGHRQTSPAQAAGSTRFLLHFLFHGPPPPSRPPFGIKEVTEPSGTTYWTGEDSDPDNYNWAGTLSPAAATAEAEWAAYEASWTDEDRAREAWLDRNM